MGRIFVTGGAGFIGSHLVKKLVSQGHEVVVADTLLRGNKIDKELLPHIEFHKADVRDKNKMVELSKGCSIIYHFAAVLGVDVVADNPVITMDTEVTGMQNIAEAAHAHHVEKLIYASTSGIYGHSAIEKSATENITVDPRTSYAMAKRYNEIYLASHYEEKGLNSISLRFFNVFGHKQDNRMVVPRFFEQAINNEPITAFGNGQQTRDFTFIDDTIEACIKLTEKVRGCEIFNIANENESSINELANEIISITGSSSKIKYIDAPKKRYDYEMERRCGNSSKLFETTGFKPTTTLREGLIKTFDYYKR
ncbi:MAG TPA: NAD-dependent epimerase/dehydratase family protein [Flavobacteriales bacterium]|nr:NAD-dependent epimerase/dehydratase family protein [Flavobacteriales bacterium]